MAVRALRLGSPPHPFDALWLPLAGLGIYWYQHGFAAKEEREAAGFLLCSVLAAGLVFQAACGGGNSTGGGGGGTPPGTTR